jgi:hypothetical protein
LADKDPDLDQAARASLAAELPARPGAYGTPLPWWVVALEVGTDRVARVAEAREAFRVEAGLAAEPAVAEVPAVSGRVVAEGLAKAVRV